MLAIIIPCFGLALVLAGCGGDSGTASARLSTEVICPTGQEHVAGSPVDVYFHKDVNAGPLDAGWTEEAMGKQLSALGSNPELVSQTKPGVYLVVYDFSKLNAASKRMHRKSGESYTQLYKNGMFLGDKMFFQAKVSDASGENVHLEVTVSATEATVTKGNTQEPLDGSVAEMVTDRRLAAASSFMSTPSSSGPRRASIVNNGVTGQDAMQAQAGHISTHLISKIGSDAVAYINVSVYYSGDLTAGPRDDGSWTLITQVTLSENAGNDDLIQGAALKAGLFMLVYDFTKVNTNAADLYLQNDDDSYRQLNPNGFFLGNTFSYVVKYAAGENVHLVLSVSDTEVTARPGVRDH